MITLTDLKKEIKRQAKKGNTNFNFLGYVENEFLSPDVRDYYFKCFQQNGVAFYNWISGNENLKQLIKEITDSVYVGLANKKEKFVDKLIKQDYEVDDVMEFADEYFQNLRSMDKNITDFKEWKK